MWLDVAVVDRQVSDQAVLLALAPHKSAAVLAGPQRLHVIAGQVLMGGERRRPAGPSGVGPQQAGRASVCAGAGGGRRT